MSRIASSLSIEPKIVNMINNPRYTARRLHAQIGLRGAALFAKVGGYYWELEVIVKVEWPTIYWLKTSRIDRCGNFVQTGYRAKSLLDELILGKIRGRHDSAINNQGVPVDEIGIVAYEKECRLGLILRGSQSLREILERPAAGDVVVESYWRAGTVRHDAIDPNFMWRELHRHRSRHIDHAGFGRGVSDAIGPSNQTGSRAKVDDFSAPALPHHLGGNVFGHEIGALKAHSDDFIEFLFRAV
jgi:hypothetical protein